MPNWPSSEAMLQPLSLPPLWPQPTKQPQTAPNKSRPSTTIFQRILMRPRMTETLLPDTAPCLWNFQLEIWISANAACQKYCACCCHARLIPPFSLILFSTSFFSMTYETHMIRGVRISRHRLFCSRWKAKFSNCGREKEVEHSALFG